MIFIFHQVMELGRNRARHITLILSSDLLRCSTVNNVCVVTDTDQERCQHNREVEAVTSLPLVKNIGRRGDDFRQLVGLWQFFILQVVCHELCTILVIVQLGER